MIDEEKGEAVAPFVSLSYSLTSCLSEGCDLNFTRGVRR